MSLVSYEGPRTLAEMIARKKACDRRMTILDAEARSAEQEARRQEAIEREKARLAAEHARQAAERLAAREKMREEIEQARRALTGTSTRAVDIIRAVSARTGISVPEIIGERRSKWIVAARFEAIYEVSVATGYSLPQIGRIFGGRDHTSILNALRKERARRQTEAGGAP